LGEALSPFRRIAVGAGLLGISSVCLLAGSAAALTVFPPTITKGFGASSVPLFGTTSLSFNIHNPNNVLALSGISFTDNFPPGLLVATPNNESGDCGGTVTATPGSSSVSLSNGSLNGAGNCTISLNVIGTWGGVKNNSVTVSSSSATGTNTSMASLTVVPPPSTARVYWDNYSTHTISFANLDGSGGGDLSTGAATLHPWDLALDPAHGRIYWANTGTNSAISFANLDGSGGGDITISGVLFTGAIGLAIDPAAGRLYWSDGNGIKYANLDGSGGHTLNVNGASIDFPQSLALDPASGRLYWVNNGATPRISYANLDGSGGHNLTISGAIPYGIAVDDSTGRIYWSDGGSTPIESATLDGGAEAGISTGTATVSAPGGLAIDTTAGRIYWANGSDTSISSVNLDGTLGQNLSVLPTGNNFPALLRAPAPAGPPTITGASTPGSALNCSTGAWAPDQPGAHFYRAPQSFAYQWTLNGAPIGGATASTLVASSLGSYSCAVTASNFLGGTTQTSVPFSVTTTGQRAAAFASCKKRAKKHNWSHKRLRKCKRKANLLPL
jgi:hypothetical protein